jgi:NTE family protein
LICAAAGCALMIMLGDAALGAEGPTPADRPKIGLALSGGGSKAGAHIGVLRVLEARGVPIDYIAGTSAGAIIGGLYAAGLSTAEIEAAIGGIDWDDMLRDAPPRSELPFRRKRDDLNYLVKSRPGFSDGEVKLPMGLLQGQKATQFFRRHLRHVSGITDFDSLPIPLRVVATDLVTGQPVVLGEGDLALAIRASMSVPVVFAPVRIGGKRLIDGGPSNNLPIDVVREMGADIVIAVDITAPYLTDEQLDSVVSVSDQMVNFLTRQNVDAQLAMLTEQDVLIRPGVGDVTTFDFDKLLDSIVPGKVAAHGFDSTWDRLARPDLQPARRASAANGGGTLAFVDIDNRSRIGTETIASFLGFKAGDPIELERIEFGVDSVYGLDVFEQVDYQLVERDGATGVRVTVLPKPWGPDYLQFGLRLSDDFSTGSDFDLGIGYLRTAVNSLGGEWRAQLDIGDRQGLSINWFQPLSHRTRWFVDVTGRVQRRNFRFFDETDALAELRAEGWGTGIFVGSEIGAVGEIRAGWRRFTGDADVQVGVLELEDDDIDIGEFIAAASYDQLDNANFPRRGMSAALTGIWSRESIGATQGYEQLIGTGLAARTWGEYTVLTSLEAAITKDQDAPVESQFLLGGLGRLSGYPVGRFIGQHYALANLTAYRRLPTGRWLPSYAGLSVELGNVWQDRDDIELSGDALRAAGALYAGTDSFLGPVYLAWGMAEGGEQTVYLYLGNPFTTRGVRPFD